MGRLQSYVVFRRDGFIVHTKPISKERAEWLLNKAYYSFASAEVKAKYLNQWGSVLNVADAVGLMYGDKWLRRWGLDDELAGIYADEGELASKISKMIEEADSATLRRELRRLARGLEEFLSKPPKPQRLERRPRPPPPAVRYFRTVYPHVRWSKLWHVTYYVPKPEWHARVLDESSDEEYGISVFSKTFWLWRQTSDPDDVKAVIVRRGAGADEMLAALINDAKAAEFLKEHGGRFLQIVNKNEEAMRKAGYEDVVDAVRALMVALSLLS